MEPVVFAILSRMLLLLLGHPARPALASTTAAPPCGDVLCCVELYKGSRNFFNAATGRCEPVAADCGPQEEYDAEANACIDVMDAVNSRIRAPGPAPRPPPPPSTTPTPAPTPAPVPVPTDCGLGLRPCGEQGSEAAADCGGHGQVSPNDTSWCTCDPGWTTNALAEGPQCSIEVYVEDPTVGQSEGASGGLLASLLGRGPFFLAIIFASSCCFCCCLCGLAAWLRRRRARAKLVLGQNIFQLPHSQIPELDPTAWPASFGWPPPSGPGQQPWHHQAGTLGLPRLERSEVEAMAKRYGPSVRPEVLNITSDEEGARAQRQALVQEADVIVSLVPASLHVGIARLAIQHCKHMVTASYVSEEMQSLDAEASAAGVLIINEVGLDPGIDHMSAMKMIDAATAGGKGRVVGFSSLCGGLPAPEAAGSSPLGYKFSWSPKGVLLAARNAARWKQEGRLHEVQGDDLLAHAKPMTLNNAFAFDVLPNRDSTAFARLYGLADAPTFFRGTLRYQGFCERMLALARLGLLETGPKPELKAMVGQRPPLRAWLAQLIGAGPGSGAAALREAVKACLGEDCAQLGLGFVEWLGLLGDEPLPANTTADAPIDVVAQLLQRQEMAYQPGERDMVVMRHELTVEKANGALEKCISTLVEYGEPRGHTAMARTVGLTAAICAQLVLDSPQRFGTGVQRPLRAEWYEPVLRSLEAEGIAMEERTEILREAQVAGVGSGSQGAGAVFAAKL